jgi:hypothetical protein
MVFFYGTLGGDGGDSGDGGSADCWLGAIPLRQEFTFSGSCEEYRLATVRWYHDSLALCIYA